MPESSQKADASCTNSATLSTSSCRCSPPGHSAAPPSPVSTKAAEPAKAAKGAGGTASSPGGCMYFRLHSGSALSSARPAGPRAASATSCVQAPTNSPATPSPGRGSAAAGSTAPPSMSWKKVAVSGRGTTKPSRKAFAIKRPSMQNLLSTSGSTWLSNGSGRTNRPCLGRRKSSFSGGSSSTHMGTSRFAARRCSSWATSV
mmetsp:Transcript_49030/g.142104  ORF Transcript_49030/g.142104 Transcript_49030/m.142104 type:complete len:202 (-) Transcript_49030:33-638(-)